MAIGRHRPQQQGDAMMQGATQSIHAERGFGFIRDANGGNVFFHRGALTPPGSFAALEVGIGVEFEPGSGPGGLRTVKITVTPIDTPAVLSFNELAASFQRHVAG
jgi:cold shock CspA family protein